MKVPPEGDRGVTGESEGGFSLQLWPDAQHDIAIPIFARCMVGLLGKVEPRSLAGISKSTQTVNRDR